MLLNCKINDYPFNCKIFRQKSAKRRLTSPWNCGYRGFLKKHNRAETLCGHRAMYGYK